jgi:15-cis-phytoene synthase
MSPDQYCREKLAARGSSAHYSLLFLPAERRRAAVALFAVRCELEEAAEQASDPAVARAALGWWAQEIARLFAGAPEHPATRALAPHVSAYGLSPEPFERLLQARFQLLQPAPFEDSSALEQHCYLLTGPFMETAARVFANSTVAAAAHARELALAIEAIRMMRDAGRYARKGRIVFPMRELHEFDVTPDDLCSARYVSGYAALLSRQAARARAALRSAAGLLPAEKRRAQAPGIILGVLYEALLDELERSGFRVLHQRIALTPLRKMLIAWHTSLLGPPRRSALSR